MRSSGQETEMKLMVTIVLLLLVFALLVAVVGNAADDHKSDSPSGLTQEGVGMRKKLPSPKTRGVVSLEDSLAKRRSVREYGDDSLSLEDVSQLLWAAQGITAHWGARTAPSAGALYPLEVVVVVGNVRDLPPGVYRLDPKEHELIGITMGDLRSQLAGAALGQAAVRTAAIDVVFTAVYQRTTRKYGDRGIQYVHMEVGHAAQNVCLQATALGLGTVPIGAFDDGQVSRLLNLVEGERPLYLIPVGKPR
jgi:SagB-type dehydrogenase family enzyme